MSSPSPTPEQWYLPSWPERFRLMGWRRIYFVPLLILLPLSLFLPFAIFFWWKVLVFFTTLPIIAAINVAKHAMRLRKEPFCIHCGYGLTGLPDGHRCPECGIPFTHHDIDDYRRDPHWFIKRRKLLSHLPPADPVFHAGPSSQRRSDGT